MDDQNKPVETSQVKPEEAPTSEPKTEQSLEVENQTQEPQAQGEEGKTRLDKRIEKLQEKLDTVKTDEDKSRILSLIERLQSKKTGYVPFPKEPLIKSEDLEQGVDPQELERRQALREMALKEEIKQEIQAQNQVVLTAQEHEKDLNETIKANPELDPKSTQFNEKLAKFVENQYLISNSVYNPITGQTEFVPVVKVSDIYKSIKSLVEEERTRAQADVRGKLSYDAQNSAIPSTPKTTLSEEDEEALIDRAKSSGTLEDWAEVLKRRLK